MRRYTIVLDFADGKGLHVAAIIANWRGVGVAHLSVVALWKDITIPISQTLGQMIKFVLVEKQFCSHKFHM